MALTSYILAKKEKINFLMQLTFDLFLNLNAHTVIFNIVHFYKFCLSER